MKAEILRRLRASDTAVSGSKLCAAAGVSRVAVWKHIRKLQELGYGITAGPRGYRLISEPDVLYPWEFEGREERVVYLPEAPSTMEIAKDLARRGCPAFTVVIAGRQVQGRGRMQRTWHSEEGGLYFTLVLRPPVPVPWSPRVNLLASATLARLLRAEYGVSAGVKWPNDILVDGRKLCGFLAEMEAEDERVRFINIGIGINVNNDPPPVTPPATSLKSLLGRTVRRRELLSRFLDELEKALEAESWEQVVAGWKAVSVTLNRAVQIRTVRGSFRGVAVDVDENGALLLQEPDGTLRTILHGDCFLDL